MADIGSGSIGMYQNRGKILGGLNRSSNPMDMALGRMAPFMKPRIPLTRSERQKFQDMLMESQRKRQMNLLKTLSRRDMVQPL
jgi:hypothetical protein